VKTRLVLSVACALLFASGRTGHAQVIYYGGNYCTPSRAYWFGGYYGYPGYAYYPYGYAWGFGGPYYWGGRLLSTLLARSRILWRVLSARMESRKRMGPRSLASLMRTAVIEVTSPEGVVPETVSRPTAARDRTPRVQ
jgi:hypothetical protein